MLSRLSNCPAVRSLAIRFYSGLLRGAACLVIFAYATAIGCTAVSEDAEVGAGPSASPPNTPTGQMAARELLEQFLDPDADLEALTAALRPRPEDYARIYNEPLATALREAHQPLWESGRFVISPYEEHDYLWMKAFGTESIRQWTKRAREDLPGGYGLIGEQIKPGFTLYRFKFVTKGQVMGLAYDGLFQIDDRWIIIPKPWRQVEK